MAPTPMAPTLMREGLVVVIAGKYRLVPMERVVQIRVHHGTTRIPGAPPWVRGFANFEGRPVEVFDAARRLGCGELRLNDRSCEIFFATGTACVGMLVDAVQRIIAVEDRHSCLSEETGQAGVPVLHNDEGTIPAIDLDAFFGPEAIA